MKKGILIGGIIAGVSVVSLAIAIPIIVFKKSNVQNSSNTTINKDDNSSNTNITQSDNLDKKNTNKKENKAPVLNIIKINKDNQLGTNINDNTKKKDETDLSIEDLKNKDTEKNNKDDATEMIDSITKLKENNNLQLECKYIESQDVSLFDSTCYSQTEDTSSNLFTNSISCDTEVFNINKDNQKDIINNLNLFIGFCNALNNKKNGITQMPTGSDNNKRIYNYNLNEDIKNELKLNINSVKLKEFNNLNEITSDLINNKRNNMNLCLHKFKFKLTDVKDFSNYLYKVDIISNSDNLNNNTYYIFVPNDYNIDQNNNILDLKDIKLNRLYIKNVDNVVFKNVNCSYVSLYNLNDDITINFKEKIVLEEFIYPYPYSKHKKNNYNLLNKLIKQKTKCIKFGYMKHNKSNGYEYENNDNLQSTISISLKTEEEYETYKDYVIYSNNNVSRLLKHKKEIINRKINKLVYCEDIFGIGKILNPKLISDYFGIDDINRKTTIISFLEENNNKSLIFKEENNNFFLDIKKELFNKLDQINDIHKFYISDESFNKLTEEEKNKYQNNQLPSTRSNVEFTPHILF